jgi:hypothetical protein
VTPAFRAAPAPILDGRWLVVRLPGPNATLSRAIVNGGAASSAPARPRSAPLSLPPDPTGAVE